jgi:hypothetical protein
LSNEYDRPPKRISTPAGMRLSIIMENTIDQKSRPRRTSRSSKTGTLKSGNISKGSTLVDYPRESKEERISGPMGYSYDIFSEKTGLPPPTLTRRLKSSNFVQRKGGWKRLLLIALVLLLCIIAIVVGVTVGLKKQNNKKNEYVIKLLKPLRNMLILTVMVRAPRARRIVTRYRPASEQQEQEHRPPQVLVPRLRIRTCHLASQLAHTPSALSSTPSRPIARQIQTHGRASHTQFTTTTTQKPCQHSIGSSKTIQKAATRYRQYRIHSRLISRTLR